MRIAFAKHGYHDYETIIQVAWEVVEGQDKVLGKVLKATCYRGNNGIKQKFRWTTLERSHRVNGKVKV